MSVADKLETLLVIKDSIKDAIIEKGVDVSDDDAFTTYADKILLIEGGGDSNSWSLVNGYWGYNEPTTYGTYKILSIDDWDGSTIKCRFRGDITFCCSSSGRLTVTDLDETYRVKYEFENNTANISYSPLDNEEHFVYFSITRGHAVIYIKGFFVVEQEYIEFLSDRNPAYLYNYEYKVTPINDSLPYHYKIYILDTLETTSLFDTSEMFENQGGIISLISFPTTKYVTNMRRMFYSSGITNLDISNWDLSNVEDMSEMFGFSNLQHFDLSNRTLPNLVTISRICSYSDILTADLSNSDLSKVLFADNLFSGCDKLQYIDMSNCDMRSADISLGWMDGLLELTYANFDNSNFSSTTSLYSWFENCNTLNSVSMRNTDFSSVESTERCFYWSPSLVNIDLSGSNFSSNIDGERMFSDCWMAKTINLSNSDFRALKLMAYFFLGCRELETINTTNANFSSVEDMGYAYSNNPKMLEIDLSYITSPNVKEMYGTFCDCENLETINMLNFIFKNVEIAHSLFADNLKLKTIIGIDNLDASSLVDAYDMFNDCISLTGNIVMHNTDSLEDMRGIIGGCENLESITFTGNLDNVKYFDDICWRCGNLRYMKMMGKPPQCSIPANALYTDVNHSPILYYNSDYDYSALIAEAINSGWTVVAI